MAPKWTTILLICGAFYGGLGLLALVGSLLGKTEGGRKINKVVKDTFMTVGMLVFVAALVMGAAYNCKHPAICNKYMDCSD